MLPSYMPVRYTIGGDYELGCALGACLQDRWPVLLDEAKALLHGDDEQQQCEPRETRRRCQKAQERRCR